MNTLDFEADKIQVANKTLVTMRNHLAILQNKMHKANKGSSEAERVIGRAKDIIIKILVERNADTRTSYQKRLSM